MTLRPCEFCHSKVDPEKQAVLIFKRPRLPDLVYCDRVACIKTGAYEAITAAQRRSSGILAEIEPERS